MGSIHSPLTPGIAKCLLTSCHESLSCLYSAPTFRKLATSTSQDHKPLIVVMLCVHLCAESAS